MELVHILLSNECSIIDVRSPTEFAGGHVAGSLNIPLAEITGRLADISEMKAPLVLCCASGGRSAVAYNMLKSMGFDCHDGGSWINVNAILSRASNH